MYIFVNIVICLKYCPQFYCLHSPYYVITCVKLGLYCREWLQVWESLISPSTLFSPVPIQIQKLEDLEIWRSVRSLLACLKGSMNILSGCQTKPRRSRTSGLNMTIYCIYVQLIPYGRGGNALKLCWFCRLPKYIP